MGRHGRVDKDRDGDGLWVEQELTFLGAGHDLQVIDQPAEATALFGQSGEGLVVDRQHPLPHRLDGRPDGGHGSSKLVRKLASELTPGLLCGLQPTGELVDRPGEGSELGAHPGVDDSSVEPPIGKAAGDISCVRDRGGEALRDRGG